MNPLIFRKTSGRVANMPDTVSKALTYIFLTRGLLDTGEELIDEFYPRLYIGSLKSAYNPRVLKRFQITHIVNCCQVENAFENGLEESFKFSKLKDLTSLVNLKLQQIQYLRICLPDTAEAEIDKHFVRAHLFINNALAIENARILIHCQAGISRSSTIAISYLMLEHNLTLDQAYKTLINCRAIIRPNRGFQQKLIGLHKELHSNINGCEEFISAHERNF